VSPPLALASSLTVKVDHADARAALGRAVEERLALHVGLGRGRQVAVVVDAELVERPVVDAAERVVPAHEGDLVVVGGEVAQDAVEAARRLHGLLEGVRVVLVVELEHAAAREARSRERLRGQVRPELADLGLGAGEQLAGRLRVVDDGELGGAVGEVLADQDRVLVDLDEGDEDVGVGRGGRLADQALLGHLGDGLLAAVLAAEDRADGLVDGRGDLLVEVEREQREEDERDHDEDPRVVGGGDAALVPVHPPEHGAES
jgi:hypothetical protein